MSKKNIFSLTAGIVVAISTVWEVTASAKLEVRLPNKMDATNPVLGQESPAERILINADWRFQKGDPSGTGDVLSYDKIKDVVVASVASSNSISGELGQNVVFNQLG